MTATLPKAARQQRFSLCVLAMIVAASAVALGQGASHMPGTWAGSFSSHNFASFPVSINVTSDARGNLHGRASMAHPCVRAATLIVTQVGSNVVLGGSDADGDTITFRGTIDPSGTLLDLSFVLNGSPSARCETDQGNGSMSKQ